MKLTIKNFWILYIIALIASFVIGAKFANAESLVLNYSTSSDRSSPQPLSGADLDGLIYVSIPRLKGSNVVLLWNPNTDLNDPAKHGYRVFQGVSAATTTTKLGSDIPHDPSKFIKFPEIDNLDKVSITYPDTSLTIDTTLQSCFRLKAFNEQGESAFSEALCTIINAVESVSFYLDDVTLSGAPMRTEKGAPYDLVGAAADGSALPFDTSSLSGGEHTLTAVVAFKQQTNTLKVSGIFNVQKKILVPTGVTVQQELVW